MRDFTWIGFKGTATLPREIGLTMAVGAQAYPGATFLGAMDLAIKDNEWRK